MPPTLAGQEATIAFIVGTYRPDRCGVAHYTNRLRENLTRKGVTSVVLTDREGAAAAESRRAVDGWRARDLLPLVRAIRGADPRILHIQHAAGTYGFRRALFLLPPLLRLSGWRGPIVTTVHEYGNWEWEPPRPLRTLTHWLKRWGETRNWWDREDLFLLTGSDALIVTHGETERLLRARLPAVSPRLHPIPIGNNIDRIAIDADRARQQLRARFTWPSETRVVAYFGFLHPVKGLETLFHAFRRVVTQRPEARLLLIGGVESLALPGDHAARYWQSLHRQVKAAGIGRFTRLTGFVPDTDASALLSGADIGVLPFNHGVNLKSGSLLTLLAHDVPVVGTRRDPAVPEFENADLVRLVPPREAAALAHALLALLDNEAAQQRMRDAGRRFIGAFSWDQVVERHLTLYRSLLEQPRRDCSPQL